LIEKATLLKVFKMSKQVNQQEVRVSPTHLLMELLRIDTTEMEMKENIRTKCRRR
jgi:hypothetical protein